MVPRGCLKTFSLVASGVDMLGDSSGELTMCLSVCDNLIRGGEEEEQLSIFVEFVRSVRDGYGTGLITC